MKTRKLAEYRENVDLRAVAFRNKLRAKLQARFSGVPDDSVVAPDKRLVRIFHFYFYSSYFIFLLYYLITILFVLFNFYYCGYIHICLYINMINFFPTSFQTTQIYQPCCKHASRL